MGCSRKGKEEGEGPSLKVDFPEFQTPLLPMEYFNCQTFCFTPSWLWQRLRRKRPLIRCWMPNICREQRLSQCSRRFRTNSSPFRSIENGNDSLVDNMRQQQRLFIVERIFKDRRQKPFVVMRPHSVKC